MKQLVPRGGLEPPTLRSFHPARNGRGKGECSTSPRLAQAGQAELILICILYFSS